MLPYYTLACLFADKTNTHLLCSIISSGRSGIKVWEGVMACDISCDFVVVIALGDAKKVHICEQRCVVPRRVVFVSSLIVHIHTCGINPGIPATKVCTSVSVKGGAATTRWRLTVAPQNDVSTI